MPAVNSSNIAHAEHDPDTGELTVQFTSGSTYVYSDVPSDVAENLHTAPSAGQYFGSMIKGNYGYRKI